MPTITLPPDLWTPPAPVFELPDATVPQRTVGNDKLTFRDPKFPLAGILREFGGIFEVERDIGVRLAQKQKLD